MGERYAIFDPHTGKQLGRSVSSREEALRRREQLRQRGPGSAPTLVRHDGGREERKREELR